MSASVLVAGSHLAHSYLNDTREVQDTSADQENKPTHPAKPVKSNIVTGWGMTEGLPSVLTEELDEMSSHYAHTACHHTHMASAGKAQQKPGLLGNTRATGSEDKVDQQVADV